MNRTLAATGAAVLVAGGLTIATANIADAGPAKQSRPSSAQAVSRADESLNAHRSDVYASSADKYQVWRTITDANGASHVRYTRTYHDLKVYGGDFIVHNAPGGAYAGADVAQHRQITVGTSPKVSSDAAAGTARASFQGTVRSTGKPALVVDATATNPRLAWDTVVTGTRPDGQTPSHLHVLTDADTGQQIRHWDDIEAVEGTGNSIYAGSVKIDTTQSGSSYQLTDPSHGNGFTCDMKNSSNESDQCSLFTGNSNTWGDGKNDDRASTAVDAHYGAALTFDFYKSTYGRNGIFGDGKGVPSRVHFGNAYVNAFWDGNQMTYGDGLGDQVPLTSIDVAAHEMSHGVSQALANLGYSGDVGGINEANSDIFGKMVEFYANNTNEPGNYEIGKKIAGDFDGKPLRYMYHPSLDGQSFDCWSSAVPESDPHYSSGVGNHLFFLLAEGSGNTSFGNSPTCNNSTVKGIGRDKAAKIWYTALDKYFKSTETYAQARQDTLKAATDLYGANSAEYQSTAAAWSAVSVS